MTGIDPFSSATMQLAALRKRDISARELLALHLERIARYNPQINAIVIPHEEQYREMFREFYRQWDILLSPVTIVTAFEHQGYEVPIYKRTLKVNQE